jgi:DNA-binding transcriptional MerR regulator
MLADIIRSMLWEGYSKEEIHEVLAAAGYPLSETWLLIERICADLEEAEIQPKTERFRRILAESLEEFREQILTEIEIMIRRHLSFRDRKRL